MRSLLPTLIAFAQVTFPVSASTRFFEVCDTPAARVSGVGPRLISEKQEQDRILEQILDHYPKEKRADLSELIEDESLFVSSPYTTNDTKAFTKLDRLCVMYATGSVSSTVRDQIDSNGRITDSGIRAALDVADRHCFVQVSRVHSSK